MRRFAFAALLVLPASFARADQDRSQLYVTIDASRGSASVLVFPTHEACRRTAINQVAQHIQTAGVGGIATCVADDGRTFFEVRCDWFGLVDRWSDNAHVMMKTSDGSWTLKCGNRDFGEGKQAPVSQ